MDIHELHRDWASYAIVIRNGLEIPLGQTFRRCEVVGDALLLSAEPSAGALCRERGIDDATQHLFKPDAEGGCWQKPPDRPNAKWVRIGTFKRMTERKDPQAILKEMEKVDELVDAAKKTRN